MRRRSKDRDEATSGRSLTAEAEKLLTSGVFDQVYYEVQVGQTFPSPRAAATHYLQHSSGKVSPHPLLDLSYFGTWFVSRLRNEQGASLLLDRLRSKAVDRALGPLFDARELDDPAEVLQAHPGGALGHFLQTKGADAPLPGREGQTLAAARPHILAAARSLAAQQALRRPRIKETWDTAAEQAWKRRWSDAPLPDGAEPLVSVVMPVRNRPDRVLRAIASVQAQTLQRWELLIVDDGSTDDTPAVLHGAAQGDPRIRVFHQEWGGVCAARNRGLAEARAGYVAFLDSDNTWREDFLRVSIAAMEGMALSAAYAAQSLKDGDEVTYRAFPGGLDDLMVANHVDLNVMVVRTDVARRVGGFDESLRRWVDHDFAIRVSEVTPLQLLPFIGVEYDDSRQADRITTTESDSWQYVVLGKHWVKWDRVRASAGARVAGRVSVVIPTWNDAKMTTRAVRALARNTPDVDLEIVVVDNGSKAAIGISLVAGTFDEPRVRIVRLPQNLNFATGSNYGFAHSTGETVIFLNNDTEPRPGWLPPLLAALEDPEVLGVQPLLQYPDDSIQACGTAFAVPGQLPVHMLVGHPPEDAERMRDKRFAVVTAAALAMRAEDVIALEGFDPLFVNGMEDVDLCLRAAELRPGHFLLVDESRVTHYEGKTEGRSTAIPTNRQIFMARWEGRLPDAELWRWHDLGFDIAHISGDGVAVPAPRLLVVRPASAEAPLRWGLRSPANGGEVGDLWGDTHFLRSLGRGLAKLGQEVVTFRHGAHSDPATAYDDVVLGIRGLDQIAPVPGKINVLWVISHPDLVTPDELRGFDLVYAASAPWAARMTARAGRDVKVLLQATDADLRADMSSPVGDGSHPLFVGGAPRDRGRPIVEAAVACSLPIAVYGPYWEGKIPDGLHLGSYVPNTQLMQLYRDHGLVLADHWDDMRDEGFLANRLFDAVASGARVVCDPIAGLELFEGAVQAYTSESELAFLCSAAGRDRFPDEASMARIADRILAEHSFDSRAELLLRDVRAELDVRRRTTPSH